MILFSEDFKELRTLYIANLRKALDMEQKITRALPAMIERSTDPKLATALSNHLDETRNHVSRVEALLRAYTGDASNSPCSAISALITEAEDNVRDNIRESIRNAGDPAIRDIIVIADAQRIQHHQIAVYGTLRTWAELLGDPQAAGTLERMLNDEKTADTLLTRLSSTINPAAGTTASLNATVQAHV